jgi:GDP-4-dehydro-6-deoxy-D-mannose reductase
MKSIFITGASGFVGGHLSEHLLAEHNYQITGTYLTEESRKLSPVKDKIKFIKLNLLDSESANEVIYKSQPDYIIHLAGASSPRESFKNPVLTFTTNVTAQINLFEAVRAAKLFNSRILIISSCEIYGYVKPEELPVDENTPLRPSTPYAVSKMTQDYLALQYFLSYQMDCVRVRPFNHIGPRQSIRFVVSDFSKQIAEIEKGLRKPVIYVGNLESKRDFTDVRDIVKAYSLLLDKGISGESYNVGSGQSYSAKDILDILLQNTTFKVGIEVDPAKKRPGDMPDIICDNKKLFKTTQWKPNIPFQQTIRDTLDYWRSIV